MRKEQRERGEIFIPEQNKGLPLDRKETDVARQKIAAVYKGKKTNPVLE